MASNYGDNLIQIWDLKTKKHTVLGQRTKIITEITLLQDGRLACVEDYNKIRIWDLESEEFIILEGHSDRIQYLITLPDGRLVSCSNDKTIRVWDLLLNNSFAMDGFAENFDRPIVLTDTCIASLDQKNNIIKIWDIKTKEIFSLQETLEDNKDELIAIVGLGKGLFASLRLGTFPIRIWDLYKKRYIKFIDYPDNFSPALGRTLLSDGRWAIGGYGGQILIIDFNGNSPILLQKDLEDELDYCSTLVWELKELPNNHLAALIDGDFDLIWDLKNREYFVFDSMAGLGTGVEAMQNGLFAFCRIDKTVCIWDLNLKKTIAIGFLEGRPMQIRYLHENNYLIVLTTAGLEIFNCTELEKHFNKSEV